LTTVKYKKICDLCGLTVEIQGFSLKNGEDQLAFCCGGCKSIYQLLYMKAQPQKIDETNNNEED